MRNHWSLVPFTLLIQSAVGSVWCVQTALFLSGGRVGLLSLKFQIIAALCLVLAGLAAAMTHLGKPGDSLHAARNLKSSWLSREIFTVNLFAGLLAIIAALAYICPMAMNGWVMLAGSLAGGDCSLRHDQGLPFENRAFVEPCRHPLEFFRFRPVAGGTVIRDGSANSSGSPECRP